MKDTADSTHGPQRIATRSWFLFFNLRRRAANSDQVAVLVGDGILENPVIVLGSVGVRRGRLADHALAALADRPLQDL